MLDLEGTGTQNILMLLLDLNPHIWRLLWTTSFQLCPLSRHIHAAGTINQFPTGSDRW